MLYSWFYCCIYNGYDDGYRNLEYIMCLIIPHVMGAAVSICIINCNSGYF